MRKLYVGLLVLMVILVAYNQPANSMEMSAKTISAVVPETADGTASSITPVIDDPVTITLPDATYTWRETVTEGGDIIEPDLTDAFTLEFLDNKVVVTTDCNHGVSSYEVNEQGIFIFGIPALTKRDCQDGQEADYLRMLADVRTYELSDEGVLVFTLKNDEGIMRFE